MIAPLLAIARERFSSLKNAIADGGYQGKATADEVQEVAGIPLEIQALGRRQGLLCAAQAMDR